MSEIIETGTLHMSLGENFGSMYTDMVREIAWYECKRDRAILMLIDSMCGMTTSQAKLIINGTMKLKTIEDGDKCSMIKDNWESPLKEIEDKKKEIEDVLAYIQQPGYEIKKPFGGVWFDYLSEEEQLRLHEFGRSVVRLIETNIWDAYREAMLLKEVSFKVMKENSKKLGDSILRGKESTENRFDILNELKKRAMSFIATSDVPEKMKRRLLRVADGQVDAMQDKVEIKKDNKFEFDTGWLNTKGVYYGCKPGQHVYLSDLLQECFYPKERKHDSQGCLEAYDWVKCTGKKWWYVGDSLLTPEQMKTIKLWSQRYGEPIIWNGKKKMIAEITRYAGKLGR